METKLMKKHEKYSPKLLPSDPNYPGIGPQTVANMLGVNVSTLGIWVRNGEISPTKTLKTSNGFIRKWSLNDVEKLRERLFYRPEHKPE